MNAPVDRIQRGLLYILAATLPISHVPVEFAVAFSIFIIIYAKARNSESITGAHAVFYLLSAYILWNLLSSLRSPRPLHSLWALVDNEWPSLTMLVLFWQVKEKAQLRSILQIFFYAASTAAVLAIIQSFTGYDLVKGRKLTSIGSSLHRSTGFYGFYLTYAAHVMNVFFLSLAYSAEERDSERKKFLYLPLLSMIAIVLTFARSIWIAIALLLPGAGFLRNKRFGIGFLVSSVVLIGILEVAVPIVRVRTVSIVDLSQNETRLNLWKTASKMIADRPVMGIGEDNFDYYFEQYRVPGYYDTTVHAHSDYFTVTVNSGFPGLLMFCAMWVMILRSGFRTWLRSSDPLIKAVSLGASLGIAGMLIAGLFQNYYGTFINCFGWWFLAGLIVAAERLEGNNVPQTSV